VTGERSARRPDAAAGKLQRRRWNQPVKLALWANKKLLARATDSNDTLPSGTVGVVVDAPPPATFGATFDNIVVRALTAG
jgi:hypothetical protein